jgi:hypothetical protein
MSVPTAGFVAVREQNCFSKASVAIWKNAPSSGAVMHPDNMARE